MPTTAKTTTTTTSSSSVASDEEAAFLTPTLSSPNIAHQRYQSLPDSGALVSAGSVGSGPGLPVPHSAVDDDDDAADDDGLEDRHHGGSGAVTGTILSSCTNLTNTILGSGMLAMPSALDSVGIMLGSLFIVLSGIASAFGLTLLALCAARVGRRSSFFAVSKITYPSAAVWFDLAIAVKCFGVSISYLVIIRDLVPDIIRATWPQTPEASFLLSKTFWVTISIFSVAPFAFARKLDSLRYTSALALMAVVYLVFIVVGYFLFPVAGMPPRPKFSDLHWFRIDGSFFKTLPIFIFAFTCHQNIFTIHNELVDNTIHRVTKVVRLSIFTSFSVYQVIGVIGYLTFGPGLKANIIQMYVPGSVITGGQISLAILFLLSYPLQCHPARACIDKVVSGGSVSGMSRRRYISITLGLLIGSYIVAITVQDLKTVLSLVGATGSTAICYILPGILYYKMRQNTDLPDVAKRWDVMKVAAVSLAAFGCVLMAVSLTDQLGSLIFGGVGDGGPPHRRRDLYILA